MIEPRNAYTSRRPTLSQGRKAPPARRDGLARPAPPGSESGACGQGSPRNLGGLVVSTGDAAWAAAINSSPGPLARPAPAGANRADGGTAKRRRTKRGGTGGEKSESADSTVEVGEPAPRGPGGGKRRIGSWAAVRKDAPAIEPDSRLNGSAAGSGEPPEMAVRGCARWRVAIPRLEEPDARIGHVRICGSRGWATTLGHPASPARPLWSPARPLWSPARPLWSPAAIRRWDNGTGQARPLRSLLPTRPRVTAYRHPGMGRAPRARGRPAASSSTPGRPGRVPTGGSAAW